MTGDPARTRPVRWPPQAALVRARDHVEVVSVALLSLEGARVAADAGLDLFGVVVLGLITAFGGGLIRDVLLGDVPPPALHSWRLLASGLVGAGMVIVAYTAIDDMSNWFYVSLDAAGVGLFCMVGVAKTLDLGLHVPLALAMGILTGVGGGVIRDVMVDQIPVVLQAELYAVSLLVGSAVFVALTRTRWSRQVAMGAGACAFFALRLLSVLLDWNLPTVPGA